ncbi:MAG: 6,7-dimethyl-8-ribityllumazine synthase [Flavobacteriales bacterium]|nr:6,7-dimethyl-8-ribityllumazine synthase [Flavobacteriales bacterium]
MATAAHHLSTYDPAGVPDGSPYRVALVVSEWNREITDSLRRAAQHTLLHHGVLKENLIEAWVPGSYELAAGAQFLLERGGLDGVICLGSVVRGETPHFDFVCQGATQGIMAVGLKFSVPVIFGVLTDDTLQQARDRSGGRHGNKGVDCAIACLKMMALKAG